MHNNQVIRNLPEIFILFSSPSIYKIIIVGNAIETVANISPEYQVTIKGETGTTRIVGWMPDQSALMGLLIRIHRAHYTIVSVEKFSHQNSTDDA